MSLITEKQLKVILNDLNVCESLDYIGIDVHSLTKEQASSVIQKIINRRKQRYNSLDYISSWALEHGYL